jgi:hypothetical protein
MEVLNACVNIDHDRYANEQLSKPLKVDGMQIYLLDGACKWLMLCKMWYQGLNMAKWFFIFFGSKNIIINEQV